MNQPIAIDYTSALTQGGGIGRYTRELITALAAEDKQTPYRLFAAGQRRDKLAPSPGSNFDWRPARLGEKWFARLWHRAHIPVPIELWTGPISLLHAPDFTLPPTRQGTRTLLTVHDLSFIRAPETSTPALRAYLNAVVPRSVARADHIIAVSAATQQDLITLYGTPADKISILHNGVDSHFRRVDDQEALQAIRNRYKLGDAPYILAVGTIQPRKNYERLVEAFRCLERSDVRLVIAGGKGWLASPLYRCIEALHMQDRVKLIGFVDDGDLPALYSGARVFAFPSLYEGFGIPPLEAMACGVPVVTSNTSSLPEVVGDAALCIDPYNVDELAEALRTTLSDETIRQVLITKGYTRIRQFTWQATARQLRKLYAKLAADSV
ncbi:MAG: glycosyltransferase family 4 protein [Anaerolineae bacterium]|nr:glycosyltransferase family 4 protein [Anaerolineae bacterium]